MERKLKLVCPHCKRDYFLLCKSGICKPADAFFEEENAELIEQKLKERGLEFGVTNGGEMTDE